MSEKLLVKQLTATPAERLNEVKRNYSAKPGQLTVISLCSMNWRSKEVCYAMGFAIDAKFNEIKKQDYLDWKPIKSERLVRFLFRSLLSISLLGSLSVLCGAKGIA